MKTMQKTISSSTSAMTGSINMLKSAMGALGIAFGVAAIINFGKQSVTAATELTNALTGLKSIVDGQGRSFSNAQKFINSYVSDGLIPATQAITAYKNLALRGYDDSQIQQVMTALKDSAAFGRQSSYTLGEAVASAAEGLKNENSILVDNAGVTKNVAKMWDDYAKSIGTTSKNLTQQQKIQAEVSGILEETRFQTGDAAKVAESFSGQTLKLRYNLNNLKVAIGNAVIPALQAILPHINNVINGFTKIANTVAQISATIFGKQSAAIGQSTQNTTEAAEAQDQLADNITSANKAAKGALSGFDELNIAQNNLLSEEVATDEIKNEIESLTGLTENLKIGSNIEIDPELETTLDGLRKLFEPFKEINFDNIVKAFDSLKKAAEPIKESLFSGLKWAMERILAPLSKFVINEAIPRFLTSLAEGFKKAEEPINKFREAIAFIAEITFQSILDFYRNALVPIGEWILGEGLPTLIEILRSITAFTFTAINDFYTKFLMPLGKWVVGEGLPKLTNIIKDQLAKINWGALNQSLANLFSKLEPFAEYIGEGLHWFLDNVLLPFGAWAADSLIPAVLDLISAALDALSKVIEIIKPHVSWLWDNFLEPAAKWTGDLFIKAINAITDGLKKFSDWAKENPEKVKDMFDAIITGLAGIMIYNTTKSIFSFLTNLKSAFAGLISSAGFAAGSIGLLTGSLAIVITNWKDMPNWAKWVSGLALLGGAALACAIAVGALQSSWSLGVAALAIVAGVVAITASVKGAQKDAESALNNSSAQASMRNSMNNAMKGGGGGRYAAGGFPSTGEIFIAREAGAELVGSIGGKTAVANNDQIVEAVSRGVYDAVSSAMNQGKGGDVPKLKVYLEGKQVHTAVESIRRERGMTIIKGAAGFAY